MIRGELAQTIDRIFISLWFPIVAPVPSMFLFILGCLPVVFRSSSSRSGSKSPRQACLRLPEV
jgi:hypothetical protein